MERRRRIATYLMLAGLLGAGVILLVGFWNYSLATRRLNALVNDCKATFRPSVLGADGSHELCDPDGIRISRLKLDSGSTRPGDTYSGPIFKLKPTLLDSKKIERLANAILAENNNREENWSNAELGAFALALICALPRGWYFLLARLAEIASAIRSNN